MRVDANLRLSIGRWKNRLNSRFHDFGLISGSELELCSNISVYIRSYSERYRTVAKKKTTTKKTTNNRKWVRLLWLAILSPIIGLGLLLLAASFSDLPSLEHLENPNNELATEILTADNVLLGKYYKKNRTNVNYAELNEHVVNALLATEDERFREHSGIDARSLARAITYLGTKGGASTLTQQLAKMQFTEKRTENIFLRVWQKAKEMIIAMRLEKSYTKDELLAMYLNEYDFLNQAIGIKSAANIYFSKQPHELEKQEAAMLVGMLKNSSLYNPKRNSEGVRNRREVVLSQMKRSGFLGQADYDSLRVLPLGLKYTPQDHIEGLAPYFREILRAELKSILDSKEGGDYKYINPATKKPYDLYTDGLRIYTTIDSRLQEYAEHGVREHLSNRLQRDFDKFTGRSLRNPPFSNDLTKKEVGKIMQSAKKRSKRYRMLSGKLCNRCERVGTLQKETKDGERKWVCSNSDCFNQQAIHTEKEIDKSFDTPTKMQVFSWKGMVDTTLSPLDSIRYYKGFLQAGMMSMDPKTGFIKAWVGGIDYRNFKYDHVRQGKRQVGSTFKPLVYATAIREGYSPCHEIPKVPTTFEKGTYNLTEDYTPQDSDRDYGYMATLNWGLSNSVNTMTAWVMKQFGPEAVVKLANDMGIESELLPVPSLCLGVADLSVYEITAANAVFANQGVYVEPIMITRIEDKNGNTIFDVIPETREALDPRTSAIMLEMMKGTVDGIYNKHRDDVRGTAMRLRMDLKSRKYDGFEKDIEIACKTGTTQNQSDGWFIGMTPDLATGVWVGAEDRSVRFNDLSLGMGTNMALPIWGHYMKKAYEDKSLKLSREGFDKPAGLNIDHELDCTRGVENEEDPFDGDIEEEQFN